MNTIVIPVSALDTMGVAEWRSSVNVITANFVSA
jgi:hypothetical protein